MTERDEKSCRVCRLDGLLFLPRYGRLPLLASLWMISADRSPDCSPSILRMLSSHAKPRRRRCIIINIKSLIDTHMLFSLSASRNLSKTKSVDLHGGRRSISICGCCVRTALISSSSDRRRSLNRGLELASCYRRFGSIHRNSIARHGNRFDPSACSSVPLKSLELVLMLEFDR